MKTKVLIATAALSVAIAAPCSAQSSVTLYGLIDVALAYNSNAQTGRTGNGLHGASQFSMQDGGTGGISGSRWGLRMNEDLGGGYAAIATLENGFTISNGTLAQGNNEFGRQAFVGVKSPYGALTLGRQYDSVVDFVQPFAVVATWGGYPLGHAGDVDNTGNTRRVNNAVKFRSLDYKGLSFGGLYSLGGVAGGTGRNQVYSMGVGYKRGPLSLGAAYLNARDPNYSFFGNNPSSGTAATSNNLGSLGSTNSAESNPIYGGYSSAHTYQVMAAGAGYVLGASSINIVYTNVQFEHLEAGDGPNPFGYSGTAKFNTIEASYTYQFTPAVVGGVVYSYTSSDGVGGRVSAHYNQAGFGMDYAVSRRSDIYFIGAYQRASGEDSFGQPAIAAITGQTTSSANHQIVASLNLRHRF